MTVRGCALVLFSIAALAACTSRAATHRNGQWIWSPADGQLLETERRSHPRFGAGVWTASITYDTTSAQPRMRLALPPSTAPTDSVTIVIRFESSFDAAWATEADSVLIRNVAARMDKLMQLLARQTKPIQEIQLDYDVPVRLLPRWSRMLAALVAGPLVDHEIWVTSLVAHLRERRYADYLPKGVAGHIVQLFDTGEAAGEAEQRELLALLDATDLPFRLGLGAFERSLSTGRQTTHRDWFAVIPALQDHPRWRGLWIFPAGRPWASRISRSI